MTTPTPTNVEALTQEQIETLLQHDTGYDAKAFVAITRALAVNEGVTIGVRE